MAKSVQQRVKKHRQELRVQGYRPIQIWVPDTRKIGFKEECARQSKSLLNDTNEADTLIWLNDISDDKGWS